MGRSELASTRYLVSVSVNENGRVCIMSPPVELACILSEASNGISIIGRSNKHDYYVEASCEAKTFKRIAKQILRRIDSLMDSGEIK